MANDEKNIIDRLFADGLGEAEMPVGNDLWKGIAAEMETDRLRKKAFVAWMTAAASLLLLLGLSTWFFVSNSFRNSEADRFTTGEVISLPFVDSTFGQDGNFAEVDRSNQNGSDKSTTPDPRIASANDQSPTGSNLPALNNTPKAGLDLSAFFIDQYGSGNGRFNRFRDRNNTQLQSGIQIEPNNSIGNTFANRNNLENSDNLENRINPNNRDNSTSGNTLASSNTPDNVEGSSQAHLIAQANPDKENGSTLNPNTSGIAPVNNTDNIEETPTNYTLQEKILVETVSPLTSLVSNADHQEIFQSNSRSEAVVASAFDFSPKVEEGPNSRWAFGGAFAPDYSFSTTSPVQDQLNNSSRTVEIQEPTEATKSNGSLVTAFTTGLNLYYRVSERLGVQSGLFYSNRKSTTTSDLSSYGKSLVLNSDFSLNQLEIPMLLQFSIVKRDHLDYYVSSGVSANLLWNYNNSISNLDGQVAARVVSDEKHTLQPSQGNFVLRTGIRYKLFNKVSLNLEPGLRYGILTNEYAFSNGKPVSLSLNSGVNYHF